MGALDAVAKVLSEAGSPLHYNEITGRAIASGLWKSSGKTPHATINAQISTEIASRGENARFERVAPGTYALRNGHPPADAADRPTADAQPGTSHISFTDAAERILNEYGDKAPMHYREIAEKALKLGLVKTEGKTPQATLYAQVITEIQRRRKRGERGRFVMHGKGFIGLTRWMATGLAFQIDQQNAQVRKALRDRLGKMPPAEFEALIASLLIKIGFDNVEVTGRSGDGGIDVRGTMVTGEVIRTRMAVQVKRWKNNVQAPTVQQVRGSLGTHDQGLIITTSDFSKGARDEAARANTIPVALMNGEQLVTLLVEHDIGVTKTPHVLLELNAEAVEASE